MPSFSFYAKCHWKLYWELYHQTVIRSPFFQSNINELVMPCYLRASPMGVNS